MSQEAELLEIELLYPWRKHLVLVLLDLGKSGKAAPHNQILKKAALPESHLRRAKAARVPPRKSRKEIEVKVEKIQRQLLLLKKKRL